MRLNPTVRSIQRLACAALLLLPCGCGTPPPEPTVAAAVAPVRPAEVKAATLPTVKFVEITDEAGIKFVHHNGARGEKLLPETMGSGAAFLDYDKRRRPGPVSASTRPTGPDTRPSPPQPRPSIATTARDIFVDVTREAGLDKTFYGQGVAVGDYDNDGDLDLYVTAIGRGYLFRNDGKGHFDRRHRGGQRPRPQRCWLTGAAFLDIDNDGDLDLFIANYVTWTPEIDKVQGFQLTGLGRAYGPPTHFGGSFCALLAQRRGPVHRYQRASRASRCARPISRCRWASRWASPPTTSTAMDWSTSPWPTTRCRISCSTTRDRASSRRSPSCRAWPSTSRVRRAAAWASTGPIS